MTRGKTLFTDVTPHEIQYMTTDPGEVTGGFCGTLKNTGKYFFLKHWRSTVMARHDLLLLTDAEKIAIKIHVTNYEHYNPDAGKTAYDVPTIMSIIFQTMRPNARFNVFNDFGTVKDVTMASCNNNVVDWISRMKMKRINIKLKIPGAYNDDKFLMDVYVGALLAKCKTFTNELQSQRRKWLIGTLPNSGRIDTTKSMIQIYSNLIEDGAWKKYLAETDQIVSLTTLVHEIQGTLKSNIIALAKKFE